MIYSLTLAIKSQSATRMEAAEIIALKNMTEHLHNLSSHYSTFKACLNQLREFFNNLMC